MLCHRSEPGPTLANHTSIEKGMIKRTVRLQLVIDYHLESHLHIKHHPRPGLSVSHDCLEPLGLSVAEGAKALSITELLVPA